MATETVDPKERTRAAEALRDVEATEPAPLSTASPPLSMAPAGTAFGANGRSGEVTIVTAAPVQGPPDEAQIRKQLEPRVWGGRGSLDEIRMLRAICSHMGDHVCRNRAADLEEETGSLVELKRVPTQRARGKTGPGRT